MNPPVPLAPSNFVHISSISTRYLSAVFSSILAWFLYVLPKSSDFYHFYSFHHYSNSSFPPPLLPRVVENLPFIFPLSRVPAPHWYLLERHSRTPVRPGQNSPNLIFFCYFFRAGWPTCSRSGAQCCVFGAQRRVGSLLALCLSLPSGHPSAGIRWSIPLAT